MTDEEITKAILSVDEHDDLSKDMVEQVLTLFSLLCHEPHRTGSKTKTEMTRVSKLHLAIFLHSVFSFLFSFSKLLVYVFHRKCCKEFYGKNWF